MAVTVPTKADPKGLDLFVTELNTQLATISWMDAPLGVGEKKQQTIDGKSAYVPLLYIAGKNNKGYISLFPDKRLGNFSWINIEDKEYLGRTGSTAFWEYRLGIVFWFDWRKVYTASTQEGYTIENIKNDVFSTIMTSLYSKGQVKFVDFKEDADEIYSGYSHREVDQDFLMRPYGGLKAIIRVRNLENC